MLKEDEANKLMTDYHDLKNKYEETKSLKDKKIFKDHELLCLQKLRYIVVDRCKKYKKFSNYEDLIQEGEIALAHSFKNVDLKKGSVFWWMQKYVSTRIYRVASTHTTIRYPMSFLKNTTPIREYKAKELSEDPSDDDLPDEIVSNYRMKILLKKLRNNLSKRQSEIINKYFGFEDNDIHSIEKIAKSMELTTREVHESLNQSLCKLKFDLKNKEIWI